MSSDKNDLGNAMRRCRPWPCKCEKAGDWALIPTADFRDGIAVLMSGQEIAAGVKPEDVVSGSLIKLMANGFSRFL